MLRRLLVMLAALVLGAAILPGCLVVPGDTSQIALVSTSTSDGWRFDFYRNSAYRCAISGFQTFMVATRVGSAASNTAPLWVWLRGDGVGWFDSSGTPKPDFKQMFEESSSSLQSVVSQPGLLSRVRNSPTGFRMLAVSYCDRDRYGGTGQTDVNNPNLQAAAAHETNGLQATKAAVQYVLSHYTTSKYFLGGAGSGSAGAYYAAYALQQQGIPPAGVVGDGGLVNVEAGMAAYTQGVCLAPEFAPDARDRVAARVDQSIADSNNEIDKLVARRELTVPLVHMWNHGDSGTCGNTLMQCPLRDDTVVTMGATDCSHQPLAAAIDAQGPNGTSMNLPVCVDNDPTPDCSLHVTSTTEGLSNTDPAVQLDYLAAIVNWVDAQLATSGPLYAWGNDSQGQLGDGTPPAQMVPTQIGNGANWAHIDAGSRHTLGIKTDGTLWAWGRNDVHQLGDGTLVPRSTPVQVGTDANWASVSAGSAHSTAIKTDGTLWAWGTVVPEPVQFINYSTPHQIGTDANWASVSAGSLYTMARKTDSTLWAWGYNNFGQFGNGTSTSSTTPVHIGTDSDWAYVVAAGIHTVAIKTNGTLWAWGYNFSGEVGDGTTTTRTSPVQIGADNDWASADGVDYTIARKTNGALWTWGANQSGQLGDGTTTGHTTPAQVGTDTDWTSVAAGGHFPLASKANGSLWAWGDNSSGQLGDGTTTNRTSPALVGAATNWSILGAGDFYALAVKADGTLWDWGRNDDGQLGNGTPLDHTKPLRIGTDTNWRTVAAGSSHTAAIKTDGTLWAWGSPYLGNGGGTSSSPIQIGSDRDWRTVATGTSLTVAIKTDGTMWAWGFNGYGQVGDGTTTTRSTPVQVGADSRWRSVTVGGYHVLALKTDGTLWAWGNNAYGELGDGTTTTRLSPVQIGTDTWRTIDAHNVTSAGIKTDNTLWRWGWLYNEPDQGTFAGVPTPQQAGGLGTNWSSVTVGDYFTKAIRTDGTQWGIGDNQFGQVGCGCDADVFTQVGVATNWSSVEAGSQHSVEIKADGTMWASGRSFFGQAGTGLIDDGYVGMSPVQIGAPIKWSAVSAGTSHNVAIASG